MRTTTPGETCTVTGNILLELFQRTKSAQSFTFFRGPLGAITHHVTAKAQGLIECRANATVIPCPAGLHFHVADAISPFAAEGVPNVLDSFELQGTVKALETLLGGQGWEPPPNATRDKRHMELPVENAVVRFP